jgi:MHS family shikimate/dehydroshikimate transporter-like MFS transporter
MPRGDLFSATKQRWSKSIGSAAEIAGGRSDDCAFAFPLFWLLGTKDPLVVVVTVVVALNFGHGTMFGLQSAYFPELFGTRVRYSGASFGFQAAAAIGGGFAPIIATALAGTIGGTAGVSLMLILLALITFAATLRARETKGESRRG